MKFMKTLGLIGVLGSLFISFSNLYSDVVPSSDISGTSLSEIDISEFSNWKNLSGDCTFHFSSTHQEVLTFKKEDTTMNFKTDAVSLLYEDDGVGIGQLQSHKPASSFYVNRIARSQHSMFGDVELVYVGNQSFVNKRRWFNDNGHINVVARVGNPVVYIQEGFFVLIKQKRENFDRNMFYVLFSGANFILASESLSSEDIFVIGDLRSFIAKREIFSKDFDLGLSRYIPKDSSVSNTRMNSGVFPVNMAIESLQLLEHPVVGSTGGKSFYVFDSNGITVFPKIGSVVRTSNWSKKINYSSHAAILQRQRQYLNDTSMVVEDPYEALVESIRHTPAIVDKHFSDNPSLSRERFEKLRKQVFIESSVPEDLDPDKSDLGGRIMHLSYLNDRAETFPETLRMYNPYGIADATRDKNGMFVRQRIIPFVMIRKNPDSYNVMFLSSDAIHMQSLYFNFMNLAEYIDRNNLVVGGTVEASYNMETGRLSQVKLINDKIYSLIHKKRIQMSADEKKRLFSVLDRAWYKVEISEDILTDD